MASSKNKKMNVPVSGMSLVQIYALLDAADSVDKEDIENLINESDTEFIDQSAIENGDVDSDLSLTKNKIETENHVIPSSIPIDAVVRVSKPDLDSADSDIPLSSLKASKDDEEWKWRKQFKEVVIDLKK